MMPTLKLGLHAGGLPDRHRPWRRASGWFGGWPWQPWPLAYAGLLTAWALILALRLLTPVGPESAAREATALIDAASPDAPAFAGTLAAERAFLFTRNDPNQL